MQPTMKLRWVKKQPFERDGFMVEICVLQQWWKEEDREISGMDGDIENIIPGKGEWRDVPVEDERCAAQSAVGR